MPEPIDFWSLLKLVQTYITENYAAILTDKEKCPQLRAYIEKYLRDGEYEVDGLTGKELINRLYNEMAEYSVLTPYLQSPELTEININAWNDVALTYRNGSIVKLKETFRNPQHAVDVVKRLLHHSGMIIDNATPIAQGHLPGNTRITAIKAPVADEEAGIAASIRLLHPQQITINHLLSTQAATKEMLDFLSVCIRYGVSVVVAGRTGTGKTTLLNCLLGQIPDNRRVFTIESGARELSLVKQENGKTINNVVHTLSRPSDNPAFDISQDQLVAASLRFSPDAVVVGEMRDREAHACVEASLTGHVVLSSVHSGAASAAHTRISLLCQRAFPIDFATSMMQTAMAFPIVVYTHKLEDNARKIMDISECQVQQDGSRQYRTLYRYHILKNEIVNDHCRIKGQFEKVNPISNSLKEKLIQCGVPQKELECFTKMPQKGAPVNV